MAPVKDDIPMVEDGFTAEDSYQVGRLSMLLMIKSPFSNRKAIFEIPPYSFAPWLLRMLLHTVIIFR
jgi:hypothetical protein